MSGSDPGSESDTVTKTAPSPHHEWVEASVWITFVVCITLIVLFRGCNGCVGGKSACIDKCPQDSNMAACVEACGKAYPPDPDGLR